MLERNFKLYEQNGVLGGAPPVEPVAPVEPTAADPIEPVVPEEPKVPRKALEDERHKRQEIDARLRQIELENAELKGKLSAGGPAPVAVTTPKPPKQEDFDSWEEFETAKETYFRNQIKQEMTSEFEQRLAVAQQHSEAQKIAQKFDERIAVAAAADPSINDIIHEIRVSGTIRVSEAMGQYITASEAAPDLLKYLSQNRQEAAQIAQMPPIMAAARMGEIKASIDYAKKTQAPPAIVSQAPEPIQPTTSPVSPQGYDPETAPMAEYYRRFNEDAGYTRRRA